MSDKSAPWIDPEAMASTLYVLYLDAVAHDESGEFDPETTGWEPSTIRYEAEVAAGATLPEANFARLMAAIAIVTTDRFWTDARAFNDLCLILSGSMPSREFDRADAADLAWGITEALLIDSPEGEPFSNEVRRYIGAVVDHEGFLNAPDVLGVALRGPIPADLPEGAAQASLEKEREIENIVKGKLLLLAGQLDQLSLRHGSGARIVESIRQLVSR